MDKAHSLPLERGLCNTLAPLAELEGFSHVTSPTAIPDNELFQQLLFFLADGSDGIYLPTHGNKQELGKGSFAACLQCKHQAPLPSADGGAVSWGLHPTFPVCSPPTRSPPLLAGDTTALSFRLSEVPRPLIPTDPRQTSSSHQDELPRAPTGPSASSSRVKKQLGGLSPPLVQDQAPRTPSVLPGRA